MPESDTEVLFGHFVETAERVGLPGQPEEGWPMQAMGSEDPDGQLILLLSAASDHLVRPGSEDEGAQLALSR